jgi:hypothetical protein
MSYGFSVVRWRQAILYIQPNLEHDITVVENHYHVLLYDLLKRIDTKLFYTKERRLRSTVILKIIYEVVCSLKLSHTVNHTAITGYLEAITDRISHLYCDLLPDKSSLEEHERKEFDYSARIFACFTRTSVLLPPEWQSYAMIVYEKVVLKTERDLSTPRLENSILVSPQLFGSSEVLFPCLKRYIPAQFLTPFGFDAACREESEYWLLLDTENILSSILNVHRAMTSKVLALAPCALSIAMKLFLQIWDVEKFRTPRRDAVEIIVALSVRLCLKFLIEILDEQYDSARLDPPRSNLSTLMYAWAEEKGDVLFPSIFSVQKEKVRGYQEQEVDQ